MELTDTQERQPFNTGDVASWHGFKSFQELLRPFVLLFLICKVGRVIVLISCKDYELLYVRS